MTGRRRLRWNNEVQMDVSEMVCLIVDVAAPLSAPRNLRHTTVTEYAATLVWDELDCRQRGGTLIYYDVRLDDVDERSDVIVDHVTSPTARFAVLSPYRRYAARVRYVNGVGVGPYSAPLSFTTLATGKYRRVPLHGSTESTTASHLSGVTWHYYYYYYYF